MISSPILSQETIPASLFCDFEYLYQPSTFEKKMTFKWPIHVFQNFSAFFLAKPLYWLEMSQNLENNRKQNVSNFQTPCLLLMRLIGNLVCGTGEFYFVEYRQFYCTVPVSWYMGPGHSFIYLVQYYQNIKYKKETIPADKKGSITLDKTLSTILQINSHGSLLF